MADLKRLLAHDNPLDQQLQDRLLLLERRVVQAVADALAEGRQVVEDALGLRALAL